MKEPVRFGKYLLLDRVNVGGMAEVFKAKTFGIEGFEKLVAIKRILPSIAEDDEFIRMFVDEAKITVKLQHANIAQVYELGKIDESYFIAMEFINGKDLKQLFEKNRKFSTPMDVAQACYIIAQVCAGLDYAHRKKDERGVDLNIIHRDVSPQNIRLSYDGEVKIIDFGIAKAKNKSSKTEAGILKGKFGYMSPEQVRGQVLDRRSDIFAIGIILYELLTNIRLFQGETDFSTLEKIRNVDIPFPTTINPNIPAELEQIIMKSLEKDRKDRYEYAHDMHDDLQRFMILNNYMYSRSELSNWMKDSYNADIQKDLAKQKEFSNYSLSNTPSQSERSVIQKNQFTPPSSNMSNPRIEAMEWDDDEMETQLFDKNPSIVGTQPEVGKNSIPIQQKLLEPKPIPKPKPRKNGGFFENNKIAIILVAVTVLSVMVAALIIVNIMKKPVEPRKQKFILSFLSTPKTDIKLYFDGLLVSEKTPYLQQDVLEGVHELKITHNDYHPIETQILLQKDKLTKKQIEDGIVEYTYELKQKNPTSLAQLKINYTPKDAKLLLNDTKISGESPYIMKDVAEGDYNVKLMKDSYIPYQKKITITKEDFKKGVYEVNVEMEQGKPVDVKITTPFGTTLFVDGEKISGKSPYNLSLITGKHKVKISGEFFDTSVRDFDVSETNNSLNISAKQKYANITFETNPTGAKVYFINSDGLKSALPKLTPVTEKVEIEKISKIIFEHPDRENKTVDFKWNSQTSQTIKETLPAKKVIVTNTNKNTNNTKDNTKKVTPKAEEFGLLSIMSRPSLDVKIDGKSIGKKTPLAKYKLSTGNHKITLYGKNNINDTFTVTIKKDTVTPVMKKYD
ncbi:serine/threonine protein kinase [bacterium]|nr:serine/threonine protein kinase [bacterium]